MKSVKNRNNPYQHTLSSDDGVFYTHEDDKHTWTDYKRIAQVIASSYSRSNNPKVLKWADKIQFCASNIAYAYEPTENNQFKKSIASVNLCKIRTCPICQWRRSLKLSITIGNKLNDVLKSDTNLSAWLVSFTIRNENVQYLKNNMKLMLKGWKKLTERKIFKPVVHWTRSLEVTAGTRNIVGDTHPHIHAILITDSSKLPSDWAEKKKWVNEWADIMSLDYTPQVDIRPVHQLGGAIKEVLKYSVKPFAESAISGWLEKVALQIDGIRLLGVSKSLNDINDNIHECTGEFRLVDELPDGIVNMLQPVILIYRWANYASQYQRQQVQYMSLKDYQEGIYIQNCQKNGIIARVNKKRAKG